MTDALNEDLPVNLAEYGTQRRSREFRENGTVRLVGKRQKKWEGIYHIRKQQPDGTLKREKRYRMIGTKADIPTKAKAEDMHREWLRRQSNQPVAESGKATVAQICDDFIELRKGDWSEEWLATQKGIFEHSIKPAIGSRTIESITAEDLKLMVNDLPNRKWETVVVVPDKGKFKRVKGKPRSGCSLSLAKKVITNIRSIFDLAMERELIRVNPSRAVSVKLKTPKAARKPSRPVISPQHIPMLVAVMTPMDQLVVWVLALGGPRPNELFAVRVINVGPNWILVSKALNRKRKEKQTKTSEWRHIYLPPELALEVNQYIVREQLDPQDLLFRNRAGNAIDRANFLNRHLRRAAERAGIDVKIDHRMFRRSFATIARLADLDIKAIQTQLGHANPDMTTGTYMQPIDAQTASQLAHLEGMMRGRIAIPVDITAKLGTGAIQ